MSVIHVRTMIWWWEVIHQTCSRWSVMGTVTEVLKEMYWIVLLSPVRMMLWWWEGTHQTHSRCALSFVQ